MCVTVKAGLYLPPTLMVPQFSAKAGRQSSERSIALSVFVL